MKIASIAKCACCGMQHGGSVNINMVYMPDVSKWALFVHGVWYSHGVKKALNTVEYYCNVSDASKAFDIEVASHK